MKVVFDAGVVFSGVGWRGEAHLCIVAMARRRLIAFATRETLAELRRVVDEIGYKTVHDPHTLLQWYYAAVKLVAPAPLGKPRSRHTADDPYLACALGAGTEAVVSRDGELLVLEKPFGVEIITPRNLLARLVREG